MTTKPDDIDELRDLFVRALKDGLVGESPKDFLTATAAYLKANSGQADEADVIGLKQLSATLASKRAELKRKMSTPITEQDTLQ